MSTSEKAWLILPPLLVALIALVATVTDGPGGYRVLDQSLVLVLVPAAAIGIERVIEFFWTVASMLKGDAWPLGRVEAVIRRIRDDLQEETSKMYEAAKTLADSAAPAVKSSILSLSEISARLATAAPDRTHLQLLAATASQHIEELRTRFAIHPAGHVLSAAEESAKQALEQKIALVENLAESATGLLSTFKDNPAKRFVSLNLGMAAGLIVAWTMGFDIFAAVNADAAAGAANEIGNAERWGIVVTGLVIGLGANPTHEVIRALQEYKKARRSDNAPTVTIGDGSRIVNSDRDVTVAGVPSGAPSGGIELRTRGIRIS